MPEDRMTRGFLALRPYLPHAMILLSLLIALGAGVAVLARGTSSQQPAQTTGAVLHLANEGISDLQTLDPARGFDFNSRQAAQLIFGGLVRFGPHFEPIPDVASSWRISKDGRTYTFHLRPNVRFADGTQVTARDVAFSFNRTLSPPFAQQSGAALLSDIGGALLVKHGRTDHAPGIQIVNPQTLRIKLEAPTATFLAKLATPAGYIVPPAAVSNNPAPWDQRAFGTGPFMVERWVHGSSLLLIPNPYYWRGKLQLKGIVMSFIPEPLDAFKRYRDGAVDVMGTVHFPGEELFSVRGQPDFHQSANLETVYLIPNLRTPPFNDTRVRQAFFHALDRNVIVRNAFGNFAHPASRMLPPGIRGYQPPLHIEGYNPGLARRLLAQAGYPGGRGFPTVTFQVDQDAQSLILATTVANQWRNTLGVRVRVARHDHSKYLALLTQLKFQIATIDWTDDYPDPENFLSQLLHSGSPNNNGDWSNATFDRLVDQADTLPPNDPKRLKLYRQAEQLAMNQAAVIPLANPTTGILVRQSIHGLVVRGGQLLAPDWTRVTIAGSSVQ